MTRSKATGSDGKSSALEALRERRSERLSSTAGMDHAGNEQSSSNRDSIQEKVNPNDDSTAALDTAQSEASRSESATTPENASRASVRSTQSRPTEHETNSS